MLENKTVYLDNAATTPVHSEVIKTITDVMTNIYGNPSSLHHKGTEAQAILSQSRSTIAAHINCLPEEIIFTSGACEANSLAIQGYMNKYRHAVLITTAIEHKSITALCADNNYNTRYLRVNDKGQVDLLYLEELLTQLFFKGYSHALVSIHAASNEIGTIQNIQKISKICHKYNAVFHTDATQLLPYQKLNMQELDIDMMSMSGQKIGAPKGIGFLYVKNGIQLKPLIYGSQMENRRGGTENIPYIAGLSKAIESLQYENTYLRSMCEYVIDRLREKKLDFIINGDKIQRLPNNLSISFKDVEAHTLLLLLDLDGICVSSGSACNSGSIGVSNVLQMIEVPEGYIHGTIRITLSMLNTYDELDYVCERIAHHVNNLRYK